MLSALTIALTACGLTLSGLPEDGVGDDASTGTDASAANSDAPTTADDAQTAGDDASLDGTTTTTGDAGSDAPAVAIMPGDAGSPTLYVVSSRFWTVNPITNTWANATALPANGCPALEDLAVDAYGNVYGLGGGLFHVDPAGPTCTQIGTNSNLPIAATFAPRGTLDPSVEVLVGYMGSGDYVRVDTTTANITVVGASALGGYNIGDLTNVGLKGYVAMTGNTCGGNDCLWEVNLATGAKVGASLGNYPTAQPITSLAHWGGKIFAYGTSDTALVSVPANPAGALVLAGPSGYTNVTYKGAASRPNAPTN
ncbi:MAG: hypothetical protein ABIP89_02430 [Polyangiaceae bacterium]